MSLKKEVYMYNFLLLIVLVDLLLFDLDKLEEDVGALEVAICYELRSLGLDDRTTLVLSNTRELNRELFYKLVYLI